MNLTLVDATQAGINEQNMALSKYFIPKNHDYREIKK
jgi:hypothetical protein